MIRGHLAHAPALATRRVGRETLAAALVLAIGMGFGRFAFTGVYPLMVRDGVLSLGAGSLAASANYAGYLLGAILVARAGPASAATLCRISLAGTVLGLLAMALPIGPAGLIGVRLLAGVVNAIALVGVSTWLFQVIDHPEGAPGMFAGVGVGIVMSAELIALGNLAGWSSAGMWLALGLLAGGLAALAWGTFGAGAAARRRPAVAAELPAHGLATHPPHPVMDAWPLILVYGLAGFGYIVTATYLPIFVAHALGAIDPVHLWAAFGLGAAPSCLLWHAVHRHAGTRLALGANLGLQLIGVVLPALSHSPAAFLASALLVGGTFVGTVTIAMPAARLAAKQVRFNMVGVMVISYGIGQILGPLVSADLYTRFGGFDAPLWAAGAALGLAVLGCFYRARSSAT